MSQRVIWIFIRKPRKRIWTGHFYRVQFSHSVVSDSLRPHELQHARPPCPSPTPGVHSNSCPSSRWWEGKQWISVCSRRVRVDRQVSRTYKHTCQCVLCPLYFGISFMNLGFILNMVLSIIVQWLPVNLNLVLYSNLVGEEEVCIYERVNMF